MIFKTFIRRILPETPDFYAMLNEQCDVVVQGADALVAFMETGHAEQSERVRELEHSGDRIKARNLEVLHRTFTTPMDREDIYRAVSAIDDILNYAKTTVREMDILHLPPDEHLLDMARLLKQGAEDVQRGFLVLKKDPMSAELEADKARKTERQTEKVYRQALAELFDAHHYITNLTDAHRDEAESLRVLLAPPEDLQAPAMATGVAFVIEILKRREVYRHMSNAADRVAHAGEVLHDIVVKTV